jgi:hypothetical protein
MSENTSFKPRHVLQFVVLVLILLLLLAAIFPNDGIKITDDFRLKFISVQQIFDPPKQPSKDISGILENTEITEDSLQDAAFDEVPKPDRDSAMVDSEYVYYNARPIHIDSVVQFLEFPPSKPDLFYGLYEEMAEIRNTGDLIRFMHYGDSQVEQDRITNYFRFKIQQQFGGYGPGLVPAVQAFDFELPMQQQKQGDWKRYTAFGRKDTAVSHDRYGVMGAFAQFAPLTPDSTFRYSENETLSPQHKYEASLSFLPSRYAYSNAKKYSRSRMFLGNITKPLDLKVLADDKLIEEKRLEPNPDLQVLSYAFEKTPKKLIFEFESLDSPEFYGFSFDTYKGIIVDNIPMRGCSGLMFTRMDLTFASRIYRMLNTKLLILQYGGNVVPTEKDDYDFYRKSFAYRLRSLKRAIPGVHIIVIGPSDMSKKEDDIYITRPEVPMVRDAMKQAAFENDCAFWDMYEAMGGENSMPSWVFYDPPLAEKDFIHFTPQGAKYVAKMFYNAFIADYNRFLRKR